jgi:hypothetical protein
MTKRRPREVNRSRISPDLDLLVVDDDLPAAVDPEGNALRHASTRTAPRGGAEFRGCSLPSYDRALHALRTWLDSWARIGRVAVGMHRQGYDRN